MFLISLFTIPKITGDLFVDVLIFCPLVIGFIGGVCLSLLIFYWGILLIEKLIEKCKGMKKKERITYCKECGFFILQNQ